MSQDTKQHQALIIDGKAYAAKLRASVATRVQALVAEHGVQPGLAVVLVGEDPASRIYVRSKHKLTVDAGMASFDYTLPASTSQAELLEQIHALNHDDRVHGSLVQLPLPEHIATDAVLTAIAPEKDVDGFHITNIGRLWSGEDTLLAPCTPIGCVMLLKRTLGSLEGLHAVVLGCSNIVGKPLANLLLREHCTVTMAHIYTRDVPAICRQGDILVTAVGQPEMVRGDWIKPGATVIDVGINRIEDEATGKRRLVGDVAFDEARETAYAITPVPGGVGPMTIACLLQNTLTAACLQNHIETGKLHELTAE